jgi:hypothetical protein
MNHGSRIKPLVALALAALAASLLSACGGSASTNVSDQFRAQTKSPLLDFGEGSSESELEEAEETVSEYLAVHSREDWKATCDLLATPMLDKIEHLAISSTGLDDKSCPTFLESFVVLSAQEKKEGAAIEGGSLRQQGDKGYLIYYGNGGVVYAMPLDRQDDSWRVAALSAQRLS